MNRYLDVDCSKLTIADVGRTVRIAGWVHKKRDMGGIIFIDLRDHYGMTQAVFAPGTEAAEIVESARSEWVLSVRGEVVARDEANRNPNLSTGDIELKALEVEVLGKSDVLPMQVATDEDISETVRLKYRFLDLRRTNPHRNIILRSQIISSLRRRMTELGFHEFQTPILTSSSPEGARDYLVPSRVHPGKFYALPQAPQQFKQLLMVSGFPRYFQIAPCFRDEDARADRSPGEFYQLDMEMAFVEQEDVFEVIENVLHGVYTEFSDRKVTEPPFPRLTYAESMSRYGSDKPDLRIPLEIVDVTEQVSGTEFKVFRGAIDSGGVVRAIAVDGIASRSRKFFDGLTSFIQGEGGKGVAYVLFPEGEEPKGSAAKFLSESELEFLASMTSPGGGVLFLSGPEKEAVRFAGRLREEVGSQLDMIEQGTFKFCWIADYPMYEADEETGAIEFSHNPFSMPQGGLEALENKDPLDILAYQYDIVCNGVELSSGAIRNHRPEIMYKAFEIAGYSREEVDERFRGMIQAFKFGAPPHGGLAPGVDRIVMQLADEPNIREVIAFPMTAKAEDLLMNAPAPVTDVQLDELCININVPEDEQS
ncbi:MAG: aspartate--tRNA ligase [Phycisphaerae bacterium]|nr:aspartate--tRNA ligase [Phycisphaerae bacterium]